MSQPFVAMFMDYLLMYICIFLSFYGEFWNKVSIKIISRLQPYCPAGVRYSRNFTQESAVFWNSSPLIHTGAQTSPSGLLRIGQPNESGDWLH